MERDKKRTNYYSFKGNEVTTQVQNNLSPGLSDGEAEVRLKKYGENKITESKKQSLKRIFILQYIFCVLTFKKNKLETAI